MLHGFNALHRIDSLTWGCKFVCAEYDFLLIILSGDVESSHGNEDGSWCNPTGFLSNWKVEGFQYWIVDMWIAHELVDYVHGHYYIHPVNLAQVDYDVDVAPPVNYLSPVVWCDLMVDGSSVFIYAAVITAV